MVTYERVVKIEPQLGKPRPIMLVAPRGGPFDMETLLARIVQSNPQTFGSPVKRKTKDYGCILYTHGDGIINKAGHGSACQAGTASLVGAAMLKAKNVFRSCTL